MTVIRSADEFGVELLSVQDWVLLLIFLIHQFHHTFCLLTLTYVSIHGFLFNLLLLTCINRSHQYEVIIVPILIYVHSFLIYFHLVHFNIHTRNVWKNHANYLHLYVGDKPRIEKRAHVWSRILFGHLSLSHSLSLSVFELELQIELEQQQQRAKI